MKLDSIKLRKLRLDHKLSQAEFAHQLGLSQATLCEWERKDTEVKADYYLKLIELFGEEAKDISKESTTININNQHSNKIGDNNMVGFNLNVDAYQMQKEQIEMLKEDNTFLKNSITLILEKFSDLLKNKKIN